VDFVTTIQNLEKGTRMDKGVLSFFQEHHEDSAKLYRCAQQLLV